MADPTRIQPRPSAVSEPYWEGCRQGELRLQFCSHCERYQFYPRLLCTECGGTDLEWRAVSGNGWIASYTVVRRGVSAAYEAPYIVALIDLEEGPRLMSQIVGMAVDAEALYVGARVFVAFQAWSDDVSMPVFQVRTP